MNKAISTNKASDTLKKDLGLDYNVGKAVVSHFFTLVHESSNGNYWEPKENYQTLISQNEGIDQVKTRIKSKVKKFWFKDQDINANEAISAKIPEKEKRRILYLEAFKIKEQRGGSKIPNEVLLSFLVSKLGHYDANHKGFQG